MSTHSPKTLDEQLVAYLQIKEGCVTEAVIPPPAACPPSVHLMYGLSRLHIFSGLIVLIFVIIIIQMIHMAIKDH